MQKPAFSLAPDRQFKAESVRHWVFLAVATLAVSGLAPLILLAGRASHFAETALVKSTFAEALVIHVDLSVIAWFLAILALFWSLVSHRDDARIPTLHGAAAVCYAFGALAIASGPIAMEGEVFFSNYIPVHTSNLFMVGLSLIFTGILLAMVQIGYQMPAIPYRPNDLADPYGAIQRYGVLGSAYILLMAFIIYGWTHHVMPEGLSPSTLDYYEMLFWGGGHVQQLAVTQVLLVAWFWLAAEAGIKIAIRPFLLFLLFSMYPLVASLSPWAFLNGSAPYDLHFFTQQMRHGGGLPAIIAGLYLLVLAMRQGASGRRNFLAFSCLTISIAVFFTGGAIGYAIGESSTVIPAHYHGSIVGCTVAFMGVIYLLLPAFGLRDVQNWKMAKIQPFLYGGGSLIHAVGLAIAGGHGAQRKTVGAMENVEHGADAAMKMARHGGSLAVLGGALFVLVVILSVRKKSKSSPA